MESLEKLIKEELGWKKFSLIDDNQKILNHGRKHFGDRLKGVVLLYNRKTLKYQDVDLIENKTNYICFIEVGEGIWNTLTYYASKKCFIIWLLKKEEVS